MKRLTNILFLLIIVLLTLFKIKISLFYLEKKKKNQFNQYTKAVPLNILFSVNRMQSRIGEAASSV